MEENRGNSQGTRSSTSLQTIQIKNKIEKVAVIRLVKRLALYSADILRHFLGFYI